MQPLCHPQIAVRQAQKSSFFVPSRAHCRLIRDTPLPNMSHLCDTCRTFAARHMPALRSEMPGFPMDGCGHSGQVGYRYACGTPQECCDKRGVRSARFSVPHGVGVGFGRLHYFVTLVTCRGSGDRARERRPGVTPQERCDEKAVMNFQVKSLAFCAAPDVQKEKCSPSRSHGTLTTYPALFLDARHVY